MAGPGPRRPAGVQQLTRAPSPALAGQVAPPAGQLRPRPDGGDPPSTSTTTRSAWASAARLEVAPMTVAPRSRRAAHSSISVAASSAGRDVVGQQQLGVAGQRAGQREPLHLAAGEPDAAVPDQRVGAAGVLDVGGQPGGLQRRARPPGRRGRAGRCRRRCRTAPAAPGRRGRPGRAAGTACGSATASAVPADLAGAGHQAGQRREQAGLARADLAEQQHQLAGLDGRGRRR